MNFYKFFEGLHDKINQAVKGDDGEVLDLIDVVMQTFIDIFKIMISVGRNYGYPRNEAEKGVFDALNASVSYMEKLFGGGDKFWSRDARPTLMKHMNSILSAYMKILVENGKIQSTDKIHVMPVTFLNLFSSISSAASQTINPNEEIAQSSLSTILSTVGRKINGGKGHQSQSDIDIELPKAILNLFGTVGSALQKEVNPTDELVQILLTLFNTWISGTKNSISGAQEVQVDTLPTYAYAAKHFDQSMLGSMDKKAVIVEADMDLTDEAKIQLWGAILGNLASGVLNKALDG